MKILNLFLCLVMAIFIVACNYGEPTSSNSADEINSAQLNEFDSKPIESFKILITKSFSINCSKLIKLSKK